MKEDKQVKSITIAGITLPLRPMNRSELKGVYTDALLNFSFYAATYNDRQFVLLEGRTAFRPTPLQCRKLTANLSNILGQPCAMMFNGLAAYERNRYIDHGVYFVVSGKYVYLPFLLINAKGGAPFNRERLQPAAQYLLLYHLQKGSLDGCSLAELTGKLPYNYLTVSRAVRQLEATMLVDVNLGHNATKLISFHKGIKTLWEEAEPLMQNPIKKVWYADQEVTQGVDGGINALSLFSDLNPESMQTKVIYDADFRRERDEGRLPPLNGQEGSTRIEVWKYPPIDVGEGRTVDQLSLALSLRDDNDPRIEKEVERMTKRLW